MVKIMLKNLSTNEVKSSGKGKEISNLDLSAFCGQMAMILNAGITMVEGLHIMKEEASGRMGKELLAEMIDNLEKGYTFNETLDRMGIFPHYMVNMVKIGEKAGKLDTVFAALARYYKKEDDVQNAVRQSVLYPAVMTVMMLVVVGFLLIKVIPIFDSVFAQLGSELTGFAKSVIVLGNTMNAYSLWIFIGLVVIVALVIFVMRTSSGKAAFSKFKENSRITRGITDKIAVARFSNGMALMLASGLDTTQSLEMIEGLIENKRMKDKVKKCILDMEDGKGFEKAMVENEIYSGLYARMLLVGFKTGSVDGVMEEISERYEEEVDQKLTNIIGIIEPTLVAVLSVIVGAILLSVMFPLISIMSALG